MKGALFVFLQRVFDIREGEYSRALLMQLNFFLLIATLLIVKPTVNGLFLAEMGASNLPSAYLLVAIFAIIVTSIYARLLGRVNLNRIILGTLLLSVALFVLLGFLLRMKIVGGWVLYAFYIVMAIFAVLSASQFWILANVIFNVREAKRIFGFIGAGAIGGGILGGYITSLLAGPLGSENLIFVAAGILFLCVPNTSYIWSKFVVTTQSKYQRRKKIPKIEHPFFLIRKSAHLTNLSGIIAISVIVAKLVDYQFGAITSGIIRDPDELTAFFGFWFSNFNVVSLIIQLILTRRIVNKLGIGGSLFLLPASIFIGAGLVLFLPALWTAIILKSSDASLKQSLNRATFELLAVPIPTEIKNQTKIFIDVVVDSLATGVGGIILIFFINGLNLTSEYVSVLILTSLGVWFYFGRKVRKTYLDAFRLNLRNLPEGEVLAINLENEAVVSDLKHALRNGSERQILAVLEKLKVQSDSRFIKELKELLNHASPKVQEETIRNLYSIHNIDLTRQITPFIRSASQPVSVAAFSYVISRAGRQAPAFIRRYLEVPDHEMTRSLLISMAEESRDNPVLKERFQLEERLDHEFDLLTEQLPEEVRKTSTIGLLRAAGLSRIPEFFPRIERFMTDPDPEVRNHAILAAGVTLDPYFIPSLIELLGEEQNADAAVLALSYYGNEIIPAIIRYIKPAKAGPNIIRKLPRVAGHFPIQLAVDFLMTLAIDPDNETSLAALDALLNLRRERPSMNFYKRKCQMQFQNEADMFHDLISHEYVLQHAITRLSNSTEVLPRTSFLEDLDELISPLKKNAVEKAARWLRLASPLGRRKVVDLPSDSGEGKNVDSSIDFVHQLPESVDKESLIRMLNMLGKVEVHAGDLEPAEKFNLPDLETAIGFLKQLGEPGLNLSQKITTRLRVKT